ncbi:MAG: Predicted transcriptional regulator YdeE, contains AraC-type DNA-binding domain [uncultured Aureispira sp.]|uniref:Predicted transcriptional regulator YdeE, contains AraC-type DNA-binding domain n=1 Tax=uncultured Aureispira sp. TaxID=1331704 RepID=A0A6S6SGL3_9BACT|nr:MAG: Predicted transcriptional regulator YdeE, contains AraC-type DNA-binding domain [uncultured Aureispira sp.]
MQKETIAPFQIIGISVRTSNQDNQAATDIPALWNRFMTETILEKIPNKIDAEIYSIYTNYEGDHSQPYDTILGCKVSSLDHIPEGMLGKTFEGGKVAKFTSKGNLEDNIVYKTWLDIWKTDLDRTYTADFEIYGAKSLDRANAEVDIFIAINE